jgi:hypothetical protein
MNDNNTHGKPRHQASHATRAAILDREADLMLSIGRHTLAEHLAGLAFELRQQVSP